MTDKWMPRCLRKKRERRALIIENEELKDRIEQHQDRIKELEDAIAQIRVLAAELLEGLMRKRR